MGYYRKFIPRFADIARPMTNLTKQDVPFEWTLQCQASFEMLKDALITSPILKYPDPNKPITYINKLKYRGANISFYNLTENRNSFRIKVSTNSKIEVQTFPSII